MTPAWWWWILFSIAALGLIRIWIERRQQRKADEDKINFQRARHQMPDTATG